MSLLYSKVNGDGTYEVINQVEAERLCWEKHDVQWGWDGKWYLVGNVPAKTQSIINQERIRELEIQLENTDAIVLELAENALLNGGSLTMPTGTDTDYATILSNRAAWRAELKQLTD